MNRVKQNGCNEERRLAVALAGGKSKRFGSDKAKAKLNGQSLIEILGGTLKACGFETLIWRAKDDPFPGEGPLQALYGALLQLDCPRLLLVACDMPLAQPPVIEKLWEESKDADITLLEFQKKPYPLPGVYSKAILPYVKQLLNQGRRDLKCLLETGLAVKTLSQNHWQTLDTKARSIYNINTLKDLEVAGRTDDNNGYPFKNSCLS